MHFRVLNLLTQHPEFSQREIAEALGISLGRINRCLRALAERDYVKIRNYRSPSNKVRNLHVLTPLGIAERSKLSARFLKRKLLEYEKLHAEIEAVQGELAPRLGRSNDPTNL